MGVVVNKDIYCNFNNLFISFILLLTIGIDFVSAEAPFFNISSYVVSGEKDDIKTNLIDYESLSKNSGFSGVFKFLHKFNPDKLKSDDEKKAFWINVYNYGAIKIVVDNLPLNSIKDAGTIFYSVWKKKLIVVGGKRYSLDDIEHKILRKEFNDPRIHFAIVCASLSCPDLAVGPFTAKNLGEQLDIATRKFLKNKTKGIKLDRKKNILYISKIFNWFEDDFIVYKNVLSFIKKYAPQDVIKHLKKHDVKIEYFHYEWSLNEQ